MSGRRKAEQAGRRRTRVVTLIGAGALPLILAACTPAPASNHADQIHTLWNITMVFAVVIFVVVTAMIVWFPIRYRRRAGQTDLPKQIHGNSKLEVLWTAIPTAIVLVLFVLSTQALGKIDSPAPPGALTVDATAFQWQWSFTYPSIKGSDGTPLTITGVSGQTKNLPVLGLPLDRPVHIHLVSGDVIHAFYVPHFLFQRDATPGWPQDFTLTPNVAGTFSGECNKICGVYHSLMLFQVRVMPTAQFDAWTRQMLAKQASAAGQCTQEQNGAVAVSAKNILFDTKCIQVSAHQPFKISFDNKDAGVPHNIAIFTNSSATQSLFTGAIVTGPKQQTYDVQGLAPGTYYFRCDVHPQAMYGKFIVK